MGLPKRRGTSASAAARRAVHTAPREDAPPLLGPQEGSAHRPSRGPRADGGGWKAHPALWAYAAFRETGFTASGRPSLRQQSEAPSHSPALAKTPGQVKPSSWMPGIREGLRGRPTRLLTTWAGTAVGLPVQKAAPTCHAVRDGLPWVSHYAWLPEPAAGTVPRQRVPGPHHADSPCLHLEHCCGGNRRNRLEARGPRSVPHARGGASAHHVVAASVLLDADVALGTLRRQKGAVSSRRQAGLRHITQRSWHLCPVTTVRARLEEHLA